MKSKTIRLLEVTGSFGEDKDAARDFRIQQVEPALADGYEVTLDFTGMTLATQSFVHALLKETITTNGAEVLDQLVFKNCSPLVKRIISTVVQYSQEGLELED